MTWRLFKDRDEEQATPAREMYLEALSMRDQDMPWPQIREHLIKGREHCPVIAEARGAEPSYELTFATREKISFDGTNYWYWGRSPSRPRIYWRPCTKLSKWSVCIGNAMNVVGDVIALTEEDAIASAMRKFRLPRREQNRVFLLKIGEDY